MLDHQRRIRVARPAPVPVAVPLRKVGILSSAAQAQYDGMSNMDDLLTQLASESLANFQPHSTPLYASEMHSQTSNILSEQDLLAQDQITVQNELKKWTLAGIIMDRKELKEFDLVRYWQNKKIDLPILYRIALDVIPAQASAVHVNAHSPQAKRQIQIAYRDLESSLWRFFKCISI